MFDACSLGGLIALEAPSWEKNTVCWLIFCRTAVSETGSNNCIADEICCLISFHSADQIRTLSRQLLPTLCFSMSAVHLLLGATTLSSILQPPSLFVVFMKFCLIIWVSVEKDEHQRRQLRWQNAHPPVNMKPSEMFINDWTVFRGVKYHSTYITVCSVPTHLHC